AFTRSCPLGLIVCVAPNCLAYSSLLSIKSTPMIVPAPASAQPWITFSPTPPQPITTALLPGSTLAVLMAAPTPVMTPQPTRHALSSGTPAGILTHEISGTTAYCARLDSAAIWYIGLPFFLSRQVPSSSVPFPIVRRMLSHKTGRPIEQ